MANDPKFSPCRSCGQPVPLDRTCCPHCAQPMLYPNVKAANIVAETDELEKRFAAAVADAKVRGCESELNALMDACKKTKAVLNCSLLRLHRYLASGTDVFETYYDLERLRVRSESGDVEWKHLRPSGN